MYVRVLIVVLLGLASPASADALRAGGTGAATKLLSDLFAGFDRADDTRLELVLSLGSSGGLRALSENVLDIAVAGRPLNADELKQGLRVAATVRTPFVLVTSHPKPNGLKSTEIADIFRAQKATWADGSPIRIILRPKSDSDTPILGGMFPGMASAIAAARTRHDVFIAATDQDNADTAERIEGSLAGSTLTQIRTERRNLHLIAIDGVTPSLETLESGAYPFSKTIYFVLPSKKDPAAERFVAFIQSSKGRELLRAGDTILIANPGKS